jgi:hypothetical protein
MTLQFYSPKVRSNRQATIASGPQPCNRDSAELAFGKLSEMPVRELDGQDLAGSGALVFEGEVLQLPTWN